jgi:hypothetical protein
MSVKFLFRGIIKTFTNAYSKPLPALIAVIWAYFAAVWWSPQEGINAFYAYLVVQIVWLIFRNKTLKTMSEIYGKKLTIKMRIVNFIVGVMVLFGWFLFWAIVLFSFINLWQFITIILAFFVPEYEQAKAISFYATVSLTFIWLLIGILDIKGFLRDAKRLKSKSELSEKEKEKLKTIKDKGWMGQVLEEND